MTISFARHQFPPAIIRHAVWLYIRFTLSYRDVEDLLAERGLDVSYETVRRWVLVRPFVRSRTSPSTPMDGNLASPTLVFGEPSPGYAWHAANVGVCSVVKSGASALRAERDALLKRLNVWGAVPLRGGLGALWSGKGAAWSNEAGVVSCGDAAGLIDPVSGEGLAAALVSGKHAGAAIASFLSGHSGALVECSAWVRAWAEARYAPSIESRIFAGWVGFAPDERELWALLSGVRQSGESASI